jgi:predicted nucleic acid-binding protein
MPLYVLDACALIALFKEEPGADAVQRLIDQAIEGTVTLFMSRVNLIEVYYKFYRLWGEAVADVAFERIHKWPIHIQYTIDDAVFYEASRLKAVYYLPLGDAIGLATAISLDGVFVSSDGELKEPEAAEHAPISWFRPPKEKKAHNK